MTATPQDPEPYDVEAVTAVRAALADAGYTPDGVAAHLGPVAAAALRRAETVPADRATRDGGPLSTLVRLFALQRPVAEAAAVRALPLDAAAALGLVERSAGEVRALVDVRPYAEDAADAPTWWVVSDLGSGLDGVERPLPADHVLGIGGASTTLAQLTPRRPVARALDLGTGCGVQALHLSRHAGAVVATDLLPRALDLARLTLGLSDVEADLRQGDLLEPVHDERFDLLVSNPPFVVAPPGAGTHVYRDSGLGWDEVSRRLVARAPQHLTPDGVAVLLANWLHERGGDWHERVAGWLPAGVDAWVVQREVQDPAEYVALWLRDSGERGTDRARVRYDEWLESFERAGVEGVGFGWVVLRRTDGPSSVRVEEWPHAVEQPLGAHVAAQLARVAWLRTHDDLFATRLAVADDVALEQHGRPGEEDPELLVLRAARGMRRAVPAGTALAAVVGACDGEVPLGLVVDAVATLLDDDPGGLRQDLAPQLRRLVEDGVLRPSDVPDPGLGAGAG